MLLRRVIGDVLRARRQGQHRTLREVSVAANVSLGYLSEIERGQKEASSELLAAICEALGSQLSEVLRDVSDSLALAENVDALTAEPLLDGAGSVPTTEPADRVGVLAGAAGGSETPEPALVSAGESAASGSEPADAAPRAETVSDGQVSVCVHRDGPLRTTLRTIRHPGFTRTIELTSPAN